MKILFFVQNLSRGGKERRLVELLSYLQYVTKYDMKVVLLYDDIAYSKFFSLGVDYIVLNKQLGKKNLSPFCEFYDICKDYKPDIIHAWGVGEVFYTIPTKFLLGIPLVNSQIADSRGFKGMSFFFKVASWINFKFSNIICSNSFAGLKVYKQDKKKKSVVIYNGLDENRFVNLADKKGIREKYGIKTEYAVIMAATYSVNKDWNRFFEIAKYVTTLRNDITFIGVGAEADGKIYKQMLELSKGHQNILIKGRCSEVENLVNVCDIGVLFSTHGEGVSNTILEYLALGKPVVVDKEGGSSEFIKDGDNGFFTEGMLTEDVGNLIIKLIDDEKMRFEIGGRGKQTILDLFTLGRMGDRFVKVYETLL